MKRGTIENEFLSLSVDARGRIVSLKNKLTSTELITYLQPTEAWRMILPTGRHTRDIVLGSKQNASKIELISEGHKKSIVISYGRVVGTRIWPVKARFVLSIKEGSKEVIAHAELTNQSHSMIEEVEFPVLGGIGGFRTRGQKRIINLVAASDRGNFFPDVLSRGLPETGRESNHFVREHETAMFESDGWAGVWLDLWSEKEGLFIGCLAKNRDFAFKLEKFPKEVPSAPAHFYPKETSRWLRVFALHVPQIEPGTQWKSEPVRIMPHKGDWHIGADRYSAYRHENIKIATPPSWMDEYVGWTEILGKTYLGEVSYDYATCADAVVKDTHVTGIDLLFYYGHSKLGAEGADFDHSPAPDLGGEEEFRNMVDKLHRNGIRIILLDHFHRWINRDIPEFKTLNLAEHAVLDEEHRLVTARWWKETFLSCRRLAGPTPVWVEMCPTSKKWLEYYLNYITKMIYLGVDGLELDTFERSKCFNSKHDHPRGMDLFPAKMEFMRTVRSHVKKLNPDFILIGETMVPEAREFLDGFYSARYLTERDRLYRYLFPEIRQQTVLVGNYAYDQVNKALSFGIGVNTEIWGLRKTTLDGCPELAQYIGEVNRFKKKYADILVCGLFRDTVDAQVEGDCLYSVLEGTGRNRALVLRNSSERLVKVRAAMRKTANLQVRLWRPFAQEHAVAKLPIRLTLKPYEAAVILALEE